MRRRRSLIALLAAALLLVPLPACSGGGASGDSVSEPATDGGATFSEAADAAAPTVAEPSIIRSGAISIEVTDPAESAGAARKIAESMGGYVESETVDRSGESRGAYLTVRVPADRIDEAFSKLGELGRVTSRSSSADDVTTAHADLKARVTALETSVARLADLMSGAASTSELLEAEAALSERQQELDGLRAQLKVLENQVDLATIQVSLETKNALPGGGPSTFWQGLLTGLDSLAAAASGSLVVLGILLPWLVVAALVALVVVLIVRAVRRHRRQRPAQGGPPEGVAADGRSGPPPAPGDPLAGVAADGRTGRPPAPGPTEAAARVPADTGPGSAAP